MTQTPYGILGALIGVGNPSQGWEVSLSGRNLTNKKYKNMAFGSVRRFRTLFIPAAPRPFELSIPKTF